MIVVDTSALLAILLDEPAADRCNEALKRNPEARISAGTLAESLIVSIRRKRADDLELLVEVLGLAVEPVSGARARRVALAHAQWGRGVHPAGLNFGDCFAYALAKELDCPLLFIGGDFSRTDVAPALA